MPLSINDGKSTPVAHVFTQDAQQNGLDPAEFVNRANVNGPSFWERLTGLLGVAKPKTSKPHVYKLRLTRPIAGIDSNGQPTVVDVHEVILTLLIGQKAASEADILDSFVMLANLCDNVTIRNQVKQMAPLLVP